MCGSLGSTLEMWELIVGPLSDSNRVIRVDLRGHGRSPVLPGQYSMDDLGRDVLDTMDELGLSRASYCGLSIGGMIGMWLGINATERLDRLILMCTALHMPPASQWRERVELVQNAGSPEPLADAVVARWFTPPWAAAHPKVVARYRAMIAATPAEGYAGCCQAIENMDLRAELGEIASPTMVIVGAEDPSTPPELGRGIAEAIGGRLEVVPRAAHLACVEQAETVARLIIDHLEGQP